MLDFRIRHLVTLQYYSTSNIRSCRVEIPTLLINGNNTVPLLGKDMSFGFRTLCIRSTLLSLFMNACNAQRVANHVHLWVMRVIQPVQFHFSLSKFLANLWFSATHVERSMVYRTRSVFSTKNTAVLASFPNLQFCLRHGSLVGGQLPFNLKSMIRVPKRHIPMIYIRAVLYKLCTFMNV